MPDQRKALVQTIKIPLFSGLSPSTIAKILSQCHSRTYEPGDVVCASDSPGEEMYILLSGRLCVVTDDAVPVATIDPVQTVGEMSMFTKHERRATVRAERTSSALVVTRAPLESILKTDADGQVRVLRNIIDILARKILDDNVRTRMHLTDKLRAEARIKILNERVEVALGLLEETGKMPREKAEAAIERQVDEKVVRVLVVDDEPVARRMMGEMLPYFDITEANSGEEALELLDKSPPDLVVTDLKMPQMNGLVLLDKLREKRPELPVLAVSGYLAEADLEGREFDGYLRKPLKIDEFRYTVDALIAAKEEMTSS